MGYQPPEQFGCRDESSGPLVAHLIHSLPGEHLGNKLGSPSAFLSVFLCEPWGFHAMWVQVPRRGQPGTNPGRVQLPLWHWVCDANMVGPNQCVHLGKYFQVMQRARHRGRQAQDLLEPKAGSDWEEPDLLAGRSSWRSWADCPDQTSPDAAAQPPLTHLPMVGRHHKSAGFSETVPAVVDPGGARRSQRSRLELAQ